MKISLISLLVAVSAHAADPNPDFKYDPNSPIALAFKAKQLSYERDGQALPTYELYKELLRLDAAERSRVALVKPEDFFNPLKTTDDGWRAIAYVAVLQKRGESGDPYASLYYGVRNWDICLRLQRHSSDVLPRMTKECWQDLVPAFKRASDAQIASATFNIARMYENGFGVMPSKLVAAEWFVKSADQYHKQGARDDALTSLELALNLVPDHPAGLRLRSAMLK
jgi:tetratricopeptide (TPR) repeat protein